VGNEGKANIQKFFGSGSSGVREEPQRDGAILGMGEERRTETKPYGG